MNADDGRRLEQAIADAREELARIDLALVALVAARLDQARTIGALKAEAGMPMYAPEQEEVVLRRVEERAASSGVDPALVRELFARIVAEARREQVKNEGGATEGP